MVENGCFSMPAANRQLPVSPNFYFQSKFLEVTQLKILEGYFNRMKQDEQDYRTIQPLSLCPVNSVYPVNFSFDCIIRNFF